MYFDICPECGAYLDPGEVCDCRDKEKAAPDAANIEDGKGKTSTNILAQTGPEVKRQAMKGKIVFVPVRKNRQRGAKACHEFSIAAPVLTTAPGTPHKILIWRILTHDDKRQASPAYWRRAPGPDAGI